VVPVVDPVEVSVVVMVDVTVLVIVESADNDTVDVTEEVTVERTEELTVVVAVCEGVTLGVVEADDVCDDVTVLVTELVTDVQSQSRYWPASHRFMALTNVLATFTHALYESIFVISATSFDEMVLVVVCVVDGQVEEVVVTTVSVASGQKLQATGQISLTTTCFSLSLHTANLDPSSLSSMSETKYLQ
jgi:hypothetical protein